MTPEPTFPSRMMPVQPYRGRFAPSPTGPLHFGSLLAALGSWLFARRAAGAWLVRIEDIDRPREVPGAARQQLATLADFGLEADEPPWRQSERSPAYRDALERLLAAGQAFPCWCSRADLARAGETIHRRCVSPPTPREPAFRLRIDRAAIGFEDRIRGAFHQDLAREVGDFVIRRADGLWAYQLAVVVDDAAQGITEVVRGADLLDSTPRQILLQRCLGLPTPAYAHLPLVLDPQGRKLGKSLASLPVDGADPLPALRAAWAALGQVPAAVSDAGSVDAFLGRARRHFQPSAVPGTDIPAGDVGR